MDSLFSGQTSFHGCIFPFIQELSAEPVKKINLNITDNMSINCFELKEELKIDGNFICSLIKLEDMDQLTSPRKIL